MSAPLPANEPQRLSALRAIDVLDTAEEDVYDQITRSAAESCDTPISLLALVDSDRVFYKSHHGVPLRDIDRDASLCGRALLEPDMLVIEDAQGDPRYQDTPAVSELGVRFFAGLPLRNEEGLPLGALCVMDRRPRTLDVQQVDILRKLTRSAERLLMLRRARGAALFATALHSSSDPIAIADATDDPRILYVNRAFSTMSRCSYHEAIGQPFHFPFPVDTRERFLLALRELRTETIESDNATATMIPYVDERKRAVYCVILYRDLSPLRQERLHAMRTTVRSCNHVMLNFLNAAMMLRQAVDDRVDRATLLQFDLALGATRARLAELSSMTEFKERKTSLGFMLLDPDP